MKICIISQDFYPSIGGVAAHVFNLSRFLARANNEVIVLSARNSLSEPFIEYVEGVKIVRFFTPDISKIRGLFFVVQGSVYIFLKSIFNRFDVIHWHNLFADTIIAWFGLADKFVFTNHTSKFLEMVDAGSGKKFYKLFFSKVDEIIAPSQELADKSREFLNFDKENIHYIPNGVDTDLFIPLSDARERKEKRSKFFEKYPGKENSFFVFCPRRLEAKNGVHFLVGAAINIVQKKKNIFFADAGNDATPDYAKNLKERVISSGIKEEFIFLGPIKNTEMKNLYQICDLVILPSLMEATSIAGLEAMSCGVPIIGTRVGGIPDIIMDGKTGFLISPSSSREIEEKILVAAESEDLLISMGKNAREFVLNNFSWLKIVSRTLDVYGK